MIGTRRTGLFTALAIGVYLALTLWRISYPGLGFDELFFVSAARGVIDHTFVITKIGFLPVYLLSYIGALKAWLYYPILKAFGVSVWSLRFPSILFTALGIAVYSAVGKRFAGPLAACFAVSLLVSNATFVGGSKIEMGPVVLEFLLQACAMWAFFTGRARLAAVICLVALFNKINFILWLAGFLPATAIVFPARRRECCWIGVLAVLGFLAWRLGMHEPAEKSVLTWGFGARVVETATLFSRAVDASAYYRFLMMPKPWSFAILPAALLAALASAWLSRGGPALTRLFAIQIPISLVALYFTWRAVSYWHYYPLLPGLYLGLGALFSRWGRAGWAAFAALLACNLYGTVRTEAATGLPPGNPRVSMGIYELIDTCKGRVCDSVEWGTHTQLLAFSSEDHLARMSGAELNPTFLYVVHDRLLNIPHTAAQKFFTLVESEGWEANLEKRIYDGDRPIHEV